MGEIPLHLPEMLDEELISFMVDMIGKTVKVDAMSLTGLRAKFAWVCVEVNLNKPLLPSLTVFDCEQKIEYEGLHLICLECGCYGHRGEDCPSLMQLVEVEPSAEKHPPQMEGPNSAIKETCD